MTDRRRMIENVFWLATEYGTRLGGGLVVSSILARRLGVEQYGVFQYTLGLIAVFSALGLVCSAEVLVPKLMYANEREKKILLGNAFLLRLIASLVAYILLLAYAQFAESVEVAKLISVLGFSLLLVEAFGVVTALLQATSNNRPKVILVNFVIIIKIFLIYIFFLKKIENPILYAFFWPLEALVVGIGLLYILYKSVGRFAIDFDRAVFASLWRDGIPFYIGLLVSCVFMKLDLIMLKFFGGKYELGLYASAAQLLQAITAFSAIMVASMAPLMVYKENNLHGVKKNTLKLVGVMATFAVSAAVGVWVLAPLILPILFGKKFEQAVPILVGLAWVAILYFVDAALNVYLVKIKKGRWISFKWILAIGFAVPVYIYAIPKYQVYGAVAGYFSGYAVACIVGLYYLVVGKTNEMCAFK